jgi:hypothetical protein
MFPHRTINGGQILVWGSQWIYRGCKKGHRRVAEKNPPYDVMVRDLPRELEGELHGFQGYVRPARRRPATNSLYGTARQESGTSSETHTDSFYRKHTLHTGWNQLRHFHRRGHLCPCLS